MSRHNGQTKKLPDPTAGLDAGDGVAALMRRYHQQMIELAFLDATDTPGIDVSFALDNPHVQTVLDQLARQIRGVAETTRAEVQALVGRQAAEGWSMEELAQQIAGLAETRSVTRAMTIARTESAAAYSQGSLAAYQASGVVSRVGWLIGPDSCDICKELEGMSVALGDDFMAGVNAPPAHPNCTCALSPIVEG